MRIIKKHVGKGSGAAGPPKITIHVRSATLSSKGSKLLGVNSGDRLVFAEDNGSLFVAKSDGERGFKLSARQKGFYTLQFSGTGLRRELSLNGDRPSFLITMRTRHYDGLVFHELVREK